MVADAEIHSGPFTYSGCFPLLPAIKSPLAITVQFALDELMPTIADEAVTVPVIVTVPDPAAVIAALATDDVTLPVTAMLFVPAQSIAFAPDVVPAVKLPVIDALIDAGPHKAL
jgi:hypothetical protein